MDVLNMDDVAAVAPVHPSAGAALAIIDMNGSVEPRDL
jgi:hypothetical protein